MFFEMHVWPGVDTGFKIGVQVLACCHCKALGFNRPGENSKIAFSLTGDAYDPQLLDLIQRCCFWRRFLWNFPNSKFEFLRLLNKGGVANRPAGSFARSASLLGWTPDNSLLKHPWLGLLDWLRCTTGFLRFALSQTWVRTVCADLIVSRPGFQLRAVDVQAMKSLLSQLQPQEVGIVRFFIHGGNYTNDVVSKWDYSKTTQCPNCDSPDSKYHRVFECQAYAGFRANFPGLFENLRQLPEAVWRFGLVPLTADTWPLLNRLHAEPLSFSHPNSSAALHIFVDGSCYWPNQRLSSVAASAAVIADVSCKVRVLSIQGCCPAASSPMTEQKSMQFCLRFNFRNHARCTPTANLRLRLPGRAWIVFLKVPVRRS